MSRPHPAGPKHGDVLTQPAPPSLPEHLGDLDPAIWPADCHRGPDGQIVIGGCAVAAVAEEFGTPVLVMSSTDLRSRAEGYVAAFAGLSAAGVDIYYAGKAFLAAAVVRLIRDAGLGLDVCTGGELALGLRAGMPPERILFHGNNKSEAELADALAAGVGRFVVDSFAELERLSALARAAGERPKVLIRVTLGVEAHTHEYIATAHEDQKFGFSLASGTAAEAVARALADPAIDLVGLHSHIGSQIFAAAGFEVAAHRAVQFLAAIRDEHAVVLPELNLGGGLGIKYTAADTPLAIGGIAADVVGIVGRECEAAGLPMPRLAFEPGRAIVGPSTVTVYRVGTVKRRSLEGGRTRVYVSVDGGMSDNIRTALYDADYTVALADRDSEATPQLCRIVGKHCESGDIVVRDAWLPGDLAPGDLLAVAATGAYNRAMASNYNLVVRPAVVAVEDGRTSPVLRRETLDDLFATDVGLS